MVELGALSRADAGLGPLVQLNIDDLRWAEFVAGQEESLPFHHPLWARLLGECYGFRPFVLALPDRLGGLAGGLPLIEAGHRAHRRWISLPYTDYCPPLFPGLSPRVVAAMLNEARQSANVTSLELRADLEGTRCFRESGFVRHTLRLEDGFDEVARRFSPSVQRSIARAQRERLSLRWAESLDDVDHVYFQLHLETRRRHGVPIQPRRWFRLLWRDILEPGHGFALLAYKDGMPIAGAVFLAENRTVVYKYGASKPEFWKLGPNHLLLLEAIRWSCENGYDVFDFGRSDQQNRGLREFKTRWGAEEVQLAYTTISEQVPRVSRRLPQAALRAVMRRSPLWLVRLSGELLYKHAA